MKPLVLLTMALLALVWLGLAGGREWLGPGALWAGLIGGQDFLIWQLRLPRVALAVGAGMALGLAGALMQGRTRNSLATPDVTGLVQGASLGHVLALVLGGSPMLGAMLGAVLALALVAWLARGQGSLAFVLYGLAVGAMAAAATTVVLQRANDGQVAQAMLWLSGSLARADAGALAGLWLALLGAAFVMLACQRGLALLWLEDGVIAALGVRPAALDGLVLALVAGLTGAAVLAVGPVAFVAFAAGPLARGLTGAAPPALAASGLMGACLLLLADLGARLVSPVVNLPAGLLMALIGAPCLLGFLWRERKRLGD